MKAAVHPHACGELLLAMRSQGCGSGSSPRLWGTPLRKGQSSFFARFIPTPVGNSIEPDGSCNGLTVHPHACGELRQYPELRWLNSGSSPRLWGTPHIAYGISKQIRFIPTPVGNSRICRCIHSVQTVHPHACGELCQFLD